VWHASVSRLSLTGKPKPAIRWNLDERCAVIEVAWRQLNGVGVEPSRIEVKGLAFHVRRSLSPEEIAGLSPEWLAIPAIDRASE